MCIYATYITTGDLMSKRYSYNYILINLFKDNCICNIYGNSCVLSFTKLFNFNFVIFNVF